MKVSLLILASILLFSCQESKEQVEKIDNRLWYNAPAAKWDHALPVGNGRLGAMVFGNPVNERIQLNEDSMWPGGPDWGDAKGSPEDLEEIRSLIKAGKVHEADQLIVERFSKKDVVRSHQTMGDLFIDFMDEGKVENYSRALSLDSALITVNYQRGGAQIIQRVLSSAPDNALVISLTTTASEGMNFKLRLGRPQDEGHPTVALSNPSEKEISMSGTVTQYTGKVNSNLTPLDYGVNFETRLKPRLSDLPLKNKGICCLTVY